MTNPETIASDVFKQAQQLIGEIDDLSRAILETDNKPPLNMVRFTQLIGQRDEKLRQMAGLSLGHLSDEQRKVLWDALEKCKAHDTHIEAHLGESLTFLDKQLQQIHHSHHVLDAYKLNVTNHNNTRSDQA